ncbi:MAG: ABC transporter ATP-binding protein [Chloroflexota bacterium]|nr:ABC transporter ATP-binding protein [Chloroflexota bacterium]
MRPQPRIFEVRGLRKAFFGLTVLDEVSLSVREGELLSIIGPNGSGKTTLFNVVSGFLPPDGGQVLYRGVDITGKPAHDIALRGIARTFQDVRLFGSLSARENLLMAAQQHQEEDFLGRFFWTRRIKGLEAAAAERAHELLALIGLEDYADFPAGRLSYGQRKLLQFGVAIVADPELLLLDEPAAAVNPTMINAIKQRIVEFNRSGKTVLLIEHNMDVVMDISHRVLVLDYGRLIAEGRPEEVRNDPQVLEAYFGR